jgi:hypothetical protein
MHDDISVDATTTQNDDTFLRRDAAAAYLNARYGFGTVRSLAKMVTQGGGPPYRKYGTRLCLYSRAELDKWAQTKMSAPRTSTSEENHRPKGRKESRPAGRVNARDRRASV